MSYTYTAMLSLYNTAEVFGIQPWHGMGSSAYQPAFLGFMTNFKSCTHPGSYSLIP